MLPDISIEFILNHYAVSLHKALKLHKFELLRRTGLVISGVTSCGTIPTVEQVAKKKHNVLLICVDDLRNELGCTGQSHMVTPNVDRLAQSGRLFTHHYVHQAACGPSRSCLLAGVRTDAWGYLGRRDLPKNEAVSLPELFKQVGYSTVTMGKVGHSAGKRYRGFEKEKSNHGPWKYGISALFGYAHGKSHHKMIWKNDKEDYLPWEAADVDDKGYLDAHNAESAVKQLQELSKEDKPFFLAVGFYKPHLPLNAPKKYWDLYEQDKLPVAKWQQKPIGVKPDWTFHHGTIKNYVSVQANH